MQFCREAPCAREGGFQVEKLPCKTRCELETSERFLDCSSSHKFPWILDWFKEEFQTSITKSQRAGIPSMRKHASEEITSVSVELCETEVCFLHIELLGTNVRLPKIQRIFPRSISNLQSLQQSLGLKVSCSDLVIYMSLHQCLQLLTTRYRLIWIDFAFV